MKCMNVMQCKSQNNNNNNNKFKKKTKNKKQNKTSRGEWSQRILR